MSVMSYGPAASDSQSQSSISFGAHFAKAAGAFWSAVQPVGRLLLKAIAEYHARRAMRELQNLDDRTLCDIGLTRGRIDYAVRRGRELEMVPFAAEWALWGMQDVPHIFKRPD